MTVLLLELDRQRVAQQGATCTSHDAASVEASRSCPSIPLSASRELASTRIAWRASSPPTRTLAPIASVPSRNEPHEARMPASSRSSRASRVT